MAFDVDGALKAGYSREEIAGFLAAQSNFDIGGARQAGYSDDEILQHLTATPVKPQAAAAQPPSTPSEPVQPAQPVAQAASEPVQPAAPAATRPPTPGASGRALQPGFMLQPEFVAEVRNSFASIAPEKRREALISAAEGEGLRAQAAKRILADVLSEDESLRRGGLLRQGMIDLVANAPQTPSSGAPGGARAAAPVTFPDMAPRLRDIMEMAPESERTARALRRDAATRGVVAAETGIEAVADRAKAAEARRDRTAGEYLGDLGTRLEQGWVMARQVVASSIDPTSKWSAELREKAEAAEKDLSPQAKYQAQQIAAKLAEQPSEWGKFGTMLAEFVTNPSTAVEEIVRQAPLLGAMIGATVLGSPVGALVTRGAMTVAPRVALADAISGGGVVAAGRVVGAATAARGGAAVAAGGDAANTVYEELTSKKNEALMRDNPDVKQLMAEGKTFEEARSEVAMTKARLAQSIAATGGAVFGAAGFERLLAQKVAGQQVKTTAARVAGTELLTEQADELITTGASNLAIGQVDPNRALTQDFGQTAATTLVTTAPLAGTAAYMASRAQEPQSNQALDPYARAVLDPQSYQPEIVSPQQTLRSATDIGPSAPTPAQAAEALRAATNASDAAAAADVMSGTLEGALEDTIGSALEPAAPGLLSSEMGGYNPLGDVRAPLTFEQMQANADLLSQSPAGVVTADPALDTPFGTGGLTDAEIEANYGLDRLRAASPTAPAEPASAPVSAPRPTTIRGTPVGQLTDADLQQIISDDTAPPISRRSASIELTARQSQAPSLQQTAAASSLMTPFAGTQGAPSATVQATGPAAQRRAAAADTQAGAVGVPDAPPGVLAGDAATADARARAQRSLDAWAKQEGVATPINLGTATPQEEAAVNQIAQALGSQFGANVFAFSDPVSRVEGVALAGRAFVNTAAPVISTAKTALHEFKHTVEQIADAETKAGMTGTAAQQFTQQIDSIFDDISESGRRAYVEKFLHKATLDAIYNPKTGKGTGTLADREARLAELMDAPTTRSEMTADFLGNRATDKQFWLDLAQEDPQGFKGFVQKWIDIVDNLLAKLKGEKRQSRDESALVDTYVRDLQKAKMVAREALIAYSKATRAEAGLTGDIAVGDNVSTTNQGARDARLSDTRTGEGVPEAARADGRFAGQDGAGQAPEYGKAREGAISVVGRHYSTAQRQTLNGAFYGQGLKGAERNRLDRSPDPRLRQRVYFYVDQGGGIRPETGVGAYAHEVRLNNVYDPASGLIAAQNDSNAFESAVLNAGFDGYIAPFGNNQAAVVLLGPKHSAVPVRAMGQVASAPAAQAAAPATLKRGLLSRELNAVDTANIPGARVRMGNLEIPADQISAANAELARIGSTARFSASRQRLVDTASLDEMLRLAQSRTWPRGRELKVAMQQKVLDAAMAAGLDATQDNAQTREYLREIGMRDALSALKQNPNAIGWYDLKTRQALAVMALVHPEIARDENARFAFTWALAVTSNGLKVDKNFELAEQAYVAYKRDGRMPTTVGIGTARGQIDDALGLFNELRDAWGMDNLRKFMQTNFTVSEITGISKALKPGGEHADVTVKGAAILGPKIGNGFFSNLYGDFGSLTMDRWLIRTWGRWTGTLIKPMPEQTAKARDRLRANLRAVLADPAQAKRLGDLVETEITSETDLDALAVAVQKASMDPNVRAQLNESDVGLELRKAGNSLAKYLDGQKEAPGNPDERKYIRAIFGDVLSQLRQTPAYKDLTMADLQAVLWYAEKRLYETSKEDPQELAADEDVEGYSDDEAPDYANAAANVARKKGITDRRINATLRKIENERSGTAGSAVAAGATPGQAAGAGQPAAVGGFTRQEKRDFIGQRAVLRARADRVGDAQSPGAYQGDGGTDGQRVRVLKSLGVSYTQLWKASRELGTIFRANDLATPEFLELAPTPENAAKFQAAISENKANLKFGAAVYVYPAEDYQGMRLFLTKDGKSGVAVKPDGDIVSVFSTGGAGRALMELAVAAGGRKLDAFDTILPKFYAPHGFRAVARTRWNNEFAPDNWSKDTFADFNNGEPDVVFMVYDPAKTDAEYSRKDGRVLTGEDAYDRAVGAQAREVRKVGRLAPVSLSRARNQETKRSTQDVARIFERMVKTAEAELTSALFNWNDSRLNEDKDKIIVYPGRDARFVRGKEGGKSNVSKAAFIDWLMSDSPFDTSVYGEEISRDAEWRSEIETLRRIVGPTDTPQMSRARTPLGFYSALADGVDNIKTNTAPAAGWKDAIKGLVNKGQVKADEVEWTGINDWLDLQQGKVSREAVAQYLRDGGVRVEETVLSDEGTTDLPAGWRVREATEDDDASYRWVLVDDNNEVRGEGDTSAEAMADGWDPDSAAERPTKYPNYTLPGGANYREVLLTLPPKKSPNLEVRLEPRMRNFGGGREGFNAYIGDKFIGWAETEDEARAYALQNAPDDGSNYRSPHWDQPNVLAHIRVNDRTDADGKRVLFVEELQSDWGQEGKKKGFAPQNVEAQLKASEERMRQRGEEIRRISDRMAQVQSGSQEWQRLSEERQRLQDEQGAETDWGNSLYDARASGVPTAPFITKTEGWLNLALKRVMIMAAEGGYDKVAFVNGKQSADRYDLSQRVNYIQWNTGYSPDRKLVTLELADGKELGLTVQDGVVEDSSIGADGKPLEDVVGKEIAGKILAAESGDLRGLDLKVGGEGMKAFYDTIVPTALKKLLPKVGGGQMGDVRIKIPGETNRIDRPRMEMLQQPGFDVTDGMREKVAGGVPLFSPPRPGSPETDTWSPLGRDAAGRIRFGTGAKAYRIAADIANNVLDKVRMKPISSDLSRSMRMMKVEIAKTQTMTAEVAAKLNELPEAERQMISDVIEGELRAGVTPPQRVLALAASMQTIMSEQSAELVRLGMLTPEAANRWDRKYLPRFYEQRIGDEVKAWGRAAKALLGRKKVMQGIKGDSLKSRGMFRTIPVDELQSWLGQGWEARDPDFDAATDTEIIIWRDFTRAERDSMGEIRDAMFRFVMGYTRSQRDIALGRLYEKINDTLASRGPQDGYVRVPNTLVEGTNAKRYGKLAGRWVPREVLDHLSAYDESMHNDLLKIYRKGLSMWKEGKTVLNPVAHANNVMSNLTMAHFAGVSYWDAHKYAGATRDLMRNAPMLQEAKDAGLFVGTFNQSELMNNLPPQLKALAGMSESRLKKGVDLVWNALSWGLRKPLGKAYEAEDLFFRYLIYRDARQRGVPVDDAVEWSQQFIFTYDDLPKGARVVRDAALPFFAYTYKVVPALTRTALEYPWRFAAPAAALYTVNALMYAMAAGDDDEDWTSIVRRYVSDKEFRKKAKELEAYERENLPPWMKGYSFTLGVPKAIRLGMDDVTNLPLFMDVMRIFPGGDLLDAQANAGGVPLLQPITPSNPVLNTLGAMLWNKDPFFGREVVEETDTRVEASEKRAKWLWQQYAPAIAVGNHHWDRALNAIANATGEEVLGYTGIGKDGLPVQPGLAAAQTVGLKVRPLDLDMSAQINRSQRQRLIRDLDAQIRRLNRLENRGAITAEQAEKQRELQREKRMRLREGLTVDGEKP